MKTIEIPMKVALEIHSLLAKLSQSTDHGVPITLNGEAIDRIVSRFEDALCKDKELQK